LIKSQNGQIQDYVESNGQLRNERLSEILNKLHVLEHNYKVNKEYQVFEWRIEEKDPEINQIINFKINPTKENKDNQKAIKSQINTMNVKEIKTPDKNVKSPEKTTKI